MVKQSITIHYASKLLKKTCLGELLCTHLINARILSSQWITFTKYLPIQFAKFLKFLNHKFSVSFTLHCKSEVFIKSHSNSLLSPYSRIFYPKEKTYVESGRQNNWFGLICFSIINPSFSQASGPLCSLFYHKISSPIIQFSRHKRCITCNYVFFLGHLHVITGGTDKFNDDSEVFWFKMW